MKHTIIRTRPAPPPVEKITLELTVGEFLTLYRRFQRDWNRGVGNVSLPLTNEREHGIIPEQVKQELHCIAQDVGIIS